MGPSKHGALGEYTGDSLLKLTLLITMMTAILLAMEFWLLSGSGKFTPTECTSQFCLDVMPVSSSAQGRLDGAPGNGWKAD